MSVLKIRQALETALNGILPALDTSWENTGYVPVAGTPYQQVQLLPAEPENPSLGGPFTREQGFMQVDLRYPLNAGPAAAAARAELTKTVFYQGASFAKGGVTTQIARTPQVMPSYTDGDRYVVSIRIRYFANI